MVKRLNYAGNEEGMEGKKQIGERGGGKSGNARRGPGHWKLLGDTLRSTERIVKHVKLRQRTKGHTSSSRGGESHFITYSLR